LMFPTYNQNQAMFGPYENIPRPKASTPKKSAPKYPRESLIGFTCSLFQDHLYFFGGWHQVLGQSSNAIQIYSLLDNQWIEPQFQGTSFGNSRFGHTASVYKNMIIFYGGKENPRGLRCIQTTNILAIDPEDPGY